MYCGFDFICVLFSFFVVQVLVVYSGVRILIQMSKYQYDRWKLCEPRTIWWNTHITRQTHMSVSNKQLLEYDTTRAVQQSINRAPGFATKLPCFTVTSVSYLQIVTIEYNSNGKVKILYPPNATHVRWWHMMNTGYNNGIILKLTCQYFKHNMAFEYCYGRHIVILCCYGSKRNSFGNECSLCGTVRLHATADKRWIREKKFMCHCKVSVRLFTSCTLNRFNFFGLQRSPLQIGA